MQKDFYIICENENDIFLFKSISKRLQKVFHYSESDAIDMINVYVSRFTDPVFCNKHNIGVQNLGFFHRCGPAEMMARVEYYINRSSEPDEENFIRWLNSLEDFG